MKTSASCMYLFSESLVHSRRCPQLVPSTSLFAALYQDTRHWEPFRCFIGWPISWENAHLNFLISTLPIVRVFREVVIRTALQLLIVDYIFKGSSLQQKSTVNYQSMFKTFQELTTTQVQFNMNQNLMNKHEDAIGKKTIFWELKYICLTVVNRQIDRLVCNHT